MDIKITVHSLQNRCHWNKCHTITVTWAINKPLQPFLTTIFGFANLQATILFFSFRALNKPIWGFIYLMDFFFCGTLRIHSIHLIIFHWAVECPLFFLGFNITVMSRCLLVFLLCNTAFVKSVLRGSWCNQLLLLNTHCDRSISCQNSLQRS